MMECQKLNRHYHKITSAFRFFYHISFTNNNTREFISNILHINTKSFNIDMMSILMDPLETKSRDRERRFILNKRVVTLILGDDIV